MNAAGIRVPFVKLWEGCKTNSARAKKMKALLQNAGIEGV